MTPIAFPDLAFSTILPEGILLTTALVILLIDLFAPKTEPINLTLSTLVGIALAFVSTQADRIRFLLPFWRVKLFHSLMTPSDVDFLQDCNVNLELPEDSELRSPVVLPTFETAEQSDRSSG